MPAPSRPWKLAGALAAAVAVVAATPLAAAAAGAAWSVQPMPDPGGTNGSAVTAVSCPSASSCLAAGWQGNSGNGAALVESWDGAKWSTLRVPLPIGATGGSFAGISCASTTSCAAVGQYSDNTQLGVAFADTWNGSRWTVWVVPVPPNTSLSYLNGVSCTAPTACLAVGDAESTSDVLYPLALRWNGKSWQITKVALPKGFDGGGLQGVSCSSAGACTAVGSFGTATNVTGRPVAERWNGTSWALQAIPVPKNAGAGSGLSSVSCPAATSCTAVGFASSGPTTGGVLAERWNGTAWSISTAPDPAGRTFSWLTSVSCAAATSCEAAGYSEGANGNDGLPLAEAFGAGKWSIQRVQLPAGGLNVFLYGISCSAAGTCTAAGGYTGSGGFSLPLAERYAA